MKEGFPLLVWALYIYLQKDGEAPQPTDELGPVVLPPYPVTGHARLFSKFPPVHRLLGH